MELQFHKSALPGLQLVKREVRNLEETQELRISDDMPDIGRVLGAWGQVILRSKEWQNGNARIAGGAQVWVLYVPEDGVGVQCIQTWIPLHAKWDLPDTATDGVMNTYSLLRSADARNTSSRKLLVRVNVGLLGEMWIPMESNLYTPEDMPEDICLLRRHYTAMVPRESGEKPFTLEEDLPVPPEAEVDMLGYYTVQPNVLEQKMLTDKVVFRGQAKLHIVYVGKDGNLHTWDCELPFSQYSELDRDYSSQAMVQIIPEITGLEVELDHEGRGHVKAGFIVQYMIFDQVEFDTVEDAYSPRRCVCPRMEQTPIPIMEKMQQMLTVEQSMPFHGSVVDVAFLQDHPYRLPGSERADLCIPGQAQLLYRGEDGTLQHTAVHWEEQWQVPGVENAVIMAMAKPTGRTQTAFDGNGTILSTEMQVDAMILAGNGIPTVTALEIGEIMPADPAGPSLILRRAGKDGLWELAKKTGSTVERIKQTNRLEAEPNPEQLLLIPVV